MSLFEYSGSFCSGMSDHSESSMEESPTQLIHLSHLTDSLTPSLSSYSSSSSSDQNICRDYLRNVCRRGAQCRYRHPAGLGAAALTGGGESLVFCHDYQNSGCQRPACRFIHCTREQEEMYRQTGQLPVSSEGQLSSPVLSGSYKEPPVCIDFMKGECKRASKCKYRHLAVAEFETDVGKGSMQTADVDRQKCLKMAAIEAAMIFEETGGNAKRRRTLERGLGLESFTRVAPAPTAVVAYSDYQLLEEENRLLHQKVDELRRHITVLVATNELLLEQNARYRTTCNVIAAVPTPIVGVSQVLTPTITPAIRTHIHHSGPHGITTMATPPAHIAAGGQREIIVQQTLVRPTVAAVGTAAAAGAAAEQQAAASGVSVAIVPMTIAVDGSTGGPSIAAALGGGGVQAMAPPPPPQMGGQNMTGAPPPPPPPQMGGQNMPPGPPPPPPPQTISAAPNLVAMTRANIISANLDVTSINMAAAPISVGNLVISAPTMGTNMGSTMANLAAAANMAAGGGAAQMGGSNMDQTSMSVTANIPTYGGSSMGTIMGSQLSLSNMVAPLNAGPPHISCSMAPAPGQIHPPPPNALTLQQQANSNMVTYPMMGHTQHPASSLG